VVGDVWGGVGGGCNISRQPPSVERYGRRGGVVAITFVICSFGVRVAPTPGDFLFPPSSMLDSYI
jgi:hypothetical protein